MKQEVNVARALPVAPDKLLVTRWPLVLVVARKHALNTHTDALGALDGAPSLAVEQIETDYAVGVHMWVHRDGSVRSLLKGDFGRFCCASEVSS